MDNVLNITFPLQKYFHNQIENKFTSIIWPLSILQFFTIKHIRYCLAPAPWVTKNFCLAPAPFFTINSFGTGSNLLLKKTYKKLSIYRYHNFDLSTLACWFPNIIMSIYRHNHVDFPTWKCNETWCYCRTLKNSLSFLIEVSARRTLFLSTWADLWIYGWWLGYDFCSFVNMDITVSFEKFGGGPSQIITNYRKNTF